MVHVCFVISLLFSLCISFETKFSDGSSYDLLTMKTTDKERSDFKTELDKNGIGYSTYYDQFNWAQILWNDREDYVALKLYTGNCCYFDINKNLRESPGNVSTKWKHTILAASSGCNKFNPIGMDTVLFRGSRTNDHSKLGTINEYSFLSTSQKLSVALGFSSAGGEILVIHHSGKNGHPISEISFYHTESEVLFPPGIQFKVLEETLWEKRSVKFVVEVTYGDENADSKILENLKAVFNSAKTTLKRTLTSATLSLSKIKSKQYAIIFDKWNSFKGFPNPKENMDLLVSMSEKRFISSIPLNWSCPPSFYNATDGCDCNCGAWDPDCYDASEEVFGCSGKCVLPGVCQYGFIPITWQCDISFYNSSDGCDCNCGAPDPDCNIDDTLPIGCDIDQECVAGLCQNTSQGVPIEWVCPPSFYKANDGCDCNCGAADPDCENVTQTLLNCPCSQMSCNSGFCVGECNGHYISIVESNVTSFKPNLLVMFLIFIMILNFNK